MTDKMPDNELFAQLGDLPDAWGYSEGSKLFPPAAKPVTPGRLARRLERVHAFKVLDHDALYDVLASIGPEITAEDLYTIHLPLVPAAWVVAWSGSRQLTLDIDDFNNKDLYEALVAARRHLGVDDNAWFARLQADANQIDDFDSWLSEFEAGLSGNFQGFSWPMYVAVTTYRRWDDLYERVAAGLPVQGEFVTFRRDRLSAAARGA
jgi:hypothetical protein